MVSIFCGGLLLQSVWSWALPSHSSQVNAPSGVHRDRQHSDGAWPTSFYYSFCISLCTGNPLTLHICISVVWTFLLSHWAAKLAILLFIKLHSSTHSLLILLHQWKWSWGRPWGGGGGGWPWSASGDWGLVDIISGISGRVINEPAECRAKPLLISAICISNKNSDLHAAVSAVLQLGLHSPGSQSPPPVRNIDKTDPALQKPRPRHS